MGSNVMNHTTMKIATAVVDHGRAAAVRAGYRSAHRSQNRERGHDATRLQAPEVAGAAKSDIKIPARLWPSKIKGTYALKSVQKYLFLLKQMGYLLPLTRNCAVML